MDFKEKQKTLFSRVKKLRENATYAELYLKEKLTEQKVYFIFQKSFIKGDFYCIVDFYLPRHKLCIEVDGEYHNTLSQKKKDWAKDNYLKSRNFRVLRIPNHKAVTYTGAELIKLICNNY
jgi:very-short-patch-repair endonuclease